MELWKFESMVKTGSLYFRRIDQFDDRLEGRQPQAIWALSAAPVQDWYRTNREHVYVCCLHLADAESPKMWKEYAKNRGVMIRTTVGALMEELSSPPLPAEPPYPAPVRVMAERTGATLADAELPSHDGFTVGVVDYVDLARADVYDLMAEGLSNTTPMFRKGKDYIDELEYRAVLRPGSAREEAVYDDGERGVAIPVRLDRLIHEVRFAPVDDPSIRTAVEELMTGAGLMLPVEPSSLRIRLADH
jgi:hypothetical protein